MEFEDAFFDTKDYKLLNQTPEKGAFGTVYIAENTNDHNKYAAKVINTDAGFDGREQMQFLRESLLLHKLDHPSIVKFKGINFKSLKDNSNILEPTIITEYLPHGSLKKNLDKERNSLADSNWTPTKKYIMLLGIADAMRYLHKHGIVHRDLKPENILTDENYYPRVCDFGFSRCFSHALTNSMQMTMTGQLGTPLYMAPEILRGDKKFGSAVDVYAFSILAYEIVTGKVPYYELGEISPFMFITQVMSGYRPKIPPNVPTKMRDLLKKCWSENASDRPSFEDIFERLSSDMTYSEETVDEDEVSDYISMLNESPASRESVGDQIEIVSLKREIESLKEKCRSYDILQTTNDDFTSGLNHILSPKTNINETMTYLNRSSEKGNRYSSYIIGLLYEKGNLVKFDIQKSLSFYEKSGQQGNSRGFNSIGLIYDSGNGVKQDLNKAIEYYQKAVILGNSNAICNLGNLYKEGRGFKQDSNKAIEYYLKAAYLGNPDAIAILGYLYDSGTCVKQDYNKAIEYYQKAADLGNSLAMNNLGFLYDSGRGVKQDSNKAIEYYLKAADLGHSHAMNNLAKLYLLGKGVKQDYNKAIEYYRKAASLGNQFAIDKLRSFNKK